MYSNNHHFLIALGSNKNLGPLNPLDILKKAIAEIKQSEISLVSLQKNEYEFNSDYSTGNEQS